MKVYTDMYGDFIFRKSYKDKNGKIHTKRKGVYKIYINRTNRLPNEQR